MSVPVHVLGGFLGSGKTTLLNALLRDARLARTAVLVNEIGSIGIDHDLVVGGGDDTLLLEGGCLCCQPRGSIADALARVLDTESPQRVLIETSGAANPVPVIEALALTPVLRSGARFSGLITVVDTLFGGETLAAHEEARLQVACADHLVLSKLDLARAASRADDLSAELDTLNGHARRHRPDPGTAPDEIVSALAGTHGPHVQPVPLPAHSARHSPNFETVASSFDGCLDAEQVQQWVGDLLDQYGDHLLRVKGVLRLRGEDRPAVLQCVRDVVHPISFAETRAGSADNRLVAITSGMHPELLREAFASLARTASSSWTRGTGT